MPNQQVEISEGLMSFPVFLFVCFFAVKVFCNQSLFKIHINYICCDTLVNSQANVEGCRTSEMDALSFVKILGMLWSQWCAMLVSLYFHLILTFWLNSHYCGFSFDCSSSSQLKEKKNSYANLLASRLQNILT